MVRWWEKKRWMYNAIIVSMTALTLFVLSDEVGISIKAKDLLFDTFWTLVWSNLLYTSGWAGGIMNHYYWGSYPFSHSSRWLLFILGTIFTVLVIESRISILVNPMFGG